MKYVPTLRYRNVERSALKEFNLSLNSSSEKPSLSNEILPLLEIVKEKPHSNMKGNFKSSYLRELRQFDIPFMLDFPLYLPLTEDTKDNVKAFLKPLQERDPLITAKFLGLKDIQNMIPVVSYPPSKYNADNIIYKTHILRKEFNRLGFRVYFNHYTDFINIIKKTKKIMKNNDILIVDLSYSIPISEITSKESKLIKEVKKDKEIKTVILKSSIPTGITNSSFDKFEVIQEANNQLLVKYKNKQFNFDAIGDYVGVKKTNLTKYPPYLPESPGFIFYYYPENIYIGYGHQEKSWGQLEDYILPNLIGSVYWNNYGENHQQGCPGCQMILDIKKNGKGKSPGKWKQISIMHYLYTINENINEL
ncbi:beta family protein [Natroniella acetigena]|uniref:beta family protein n=1 Tax=Natroniella acetigena TaxID=52004 RepID=UPI00200B0616|nr:beta family protein [Natroniella acetigena]MCK8827933.1 beta family protein [Natroniella acetigena]